MRSSVIRQKFIDFFKTKGHQQIPSAPLIPENDPTVLFTTAGMHPLVPFLIGATHPLGKRLVNAQKCLRTDDIDEVGDATHLTFFEMLGNWSLGDFFKTETISWSFEFLTSRDWLGLDINKIAVSVFAGDADAGRDDESAKIWQDQGIPADRIAYLPKKDNWWGPAGQTGPCGPDTEMFYWTGDSTAPAKFDPTDKLWVEIWNDVFMQYNKQADATFVALKQKNVDTGMGLERITAIIQHKSTVYETDLFQPLIAKIRQAVPAGTPDTERAGRIIADHIRAATFILGDQYGVTPSNLGQGYVLRKLIRRAIRYVNQLNIKTEILTDLARLVIINFKDAYPEISDKKNHILEQLSAEIEKFARTLEKGLHVFNKQILDQKILSGKEAFYFYETYGFPPELMADICREQGIEFDQAEFDKAEVEHQSLSREAGSQKFSGGLADHSDTTAKLHTATHLLHQALRQTLGDQVAQKGSNITAERLRFDFAHPGPLTKDELRQVENIVNDQINAGAVITMVEMTVPEARAQGAIGLFPDRYQEQVKVYAIGNFSKEICGGPHAGNTADLGHFKILKEESSSAGVRRIKAVLE